MSLYMKKSIILLISVITLIITFVFAEIFSIYHFGSVPTLLTTLYLIIIFSIFCIYWILQIGFTYGIIKPRKGWVQWNKKFRLNGKPNEPTDKSQDLRTVTTGKSSPWDSKTGPDGLPEKIIRKAISDPVEMRGNQWC